MALSYGTVTGRFEDTASGLVPVAGKVYFTPVPGYLTTDDTFILPNTESVELVDGAFSIELLATDDASISTRDWTYRVDLALLENGRPVKVEAFHIKVPGGEVTNLASAAPVASSNGTAITRGPAGPVGPASTVQGPSGVRGSRWYVSGVGHVDFTDVTGMLSGDIFLYPASRDLFQYNGTEWTYAGTLGA